MSYQQLYDSMAVNSDKVTKAAALAAKMVLNKKRYEAVSNALNIPWYVVAVIHYRESSNSFSRHLHNGDPLTTRTTHVPKGRPIEGNPPFSWEDSAIDALTMQKLHKVTDWSIENTLVLLEKYNGLGYKKKGMPSPYIWSWSNNYQSGKYVADGKFDPNVKDAQCGVAVLLKYLIT